MLSKDIEPLKWKFHISFHPTIVWNRRPQRSFGTPQNSTICSPNPTSHPRSFYSPMLHYWGVRYHTCLSSPKDVRLSMYWLWLSVAEAERGRGPGHQGTWCRCICFHVSVMDLKPNLKNLLKWLVNYSPGDVSVPVILDPHGTLSQPETIASLKARPRHLAVVWLRILVAGSQSFRLDAIWNPPTPF